MFLTNYDTRILCVNRFFPPKSRERMLNCPDFIKRFRQRSTLIPKFATDNSLLTKIGDVLNAR